MCFPLSFSCTPSAMGYFLEFVNDSLVSNSFHAFIFVSWIPPYQARGRLFVALRLHGMTHGRGLFKSAEMLGARVSRSEAYFFVGRSDANGAQQRRSVLFNSPIYSRSNVMPYFSSFLSKVGREIPRTSQISPLFLSVSLITLRM
jgi:hypothetical protein